MIHRQGYLLKCVDAEKNGRYNKMKNAEQIVPERRNMRKLALSDEILLNIEKPARYIGNEVNSVMKDPEKVDIRFAMCFPDVSEVL